MDAGSLHKFICAGCTLFTTLKAQASNFFTFHKLHQLAMPLSCLPAFSLLRRSLSRGILRRRRRSMAQSDEMSALKMATVDWSQGSIVRHACMSILLFEVGSNQWTVHTQARVLSARY